MLLLRLAIVSSTLNLAAAQIGLGNGASQGIF